MATIISRIGFCEVCKKESRPKTGQAFLVMGSSSSKFKACYATHNGRAGFVPFSYRLRKVIDDRVFYQKICSICGSYPLEEDGKNYLCMDESLWSGWIKTTLSNWNALVTFKNTGYEI